MQRERALSKREGIDLEHLAVLTEVDEAAEEDQEDPGMGGSQLEHRLLWHLRLLQREDERKQGGAPWDACDAPRITRERQPRRRREQPGRRHAEQVEGLQDARWPGDLERHHRARRGCCSRGRRRLPVGGAACRELAPIGLGHHEVHADASHHA